MDENSTLHSSGSLKSVTERLVMHLSQQKAQTFDLNSVASSLGVSKRRLYDVMNILQPLGLISRLSSGTYRWQQLDPTTIQRVAPTEQHSSHIRDLSAAFISYIRKQTTDIIPIDDLTSTIFKSSKEMLRRLYDITAVYEALGLIKRESRASDIYVTPLFRTLFSTVNLIPLKKRSSLMPIYVKKPVPILNSYN